MRKIIIACFCLITVAAAQVQSPEGVNFMQPLLMDSLHHQLNFYDFAYNPAALYEDEQVKLLWVGQNTRYSDGGLRLPYQAQTINDQNYFASTVYPISENDIFKGHFSYNHIREDAVQWAHQSRRLEYNPFVLADSSTGDFRLNGLHWAAEWAHRFNSSWLAGFRFAYNVDQRLKQVFPKPLNKHRDIYMRAGTQYRLKNWKIGLIYAYRDEQEKVEITKYNLDQTLTPVFYKFRFSDLPVILEGETSEERKINDSGHFISVQLSGTIYGFTLMTRAGYQENDGNVLDGGSRKEEQGRFNWEKAQAQVRVLKKFRFAKLNFDYRVSRQEDRAYHPDFDFRYMNQTSLWHRASIGSQVRISAKSDIYCDLSCSYHWNEKTDRITDNHWDYEINKYEVRLGARHKISRAWEGALWAGYGKYDLLNDERSVHETNEFYNYLFNDPFVYFASMNQNWLSGLRIVYHYRPLLDAGIHSVFSQNRALNGYRYGKERNNLNLSLWIKLYIF